MLDPTPTILAIGAAGRFGGLVVPELVRQGATVRAFVQNDAKAAIARKNGAAEIAIGDLREPKSLERAMQRIDGVFHIGPAFVEDEAELGLRVVETARRSGVRRIVFSSVIHATNTHLANHASKLPVENAIFMSGLEYTILHPAMFFQNIAPSWPTIVQRGTVAEPFPKTVRIARVDYRDVAEVAAMAFTGDRLLYGTFELTAAMLDRREIASIMSEVLGRDITAIDVEFDDWAADLPVDDSQKVLLAKLFASYAEYGSGGNGLILKAILGREPRSLRRYIEDLASAS